VATEAPSHPAMAVVDKMYACFAKGDNLGSHHHIQHLLPIAFMSFNGIVGMDAYAGIDGRISLGILDAPLCRCSGGSDADHPLHACFLSTLDDGFHLAPQPIIIQMDMGIDQIQ